MDNKILFMYVILLQAIGLSLFATGYHNVDLCENEYKIQCEYNQKFDLESWITEKTLAGLPMSLENCYLLGMVCIHMSIIIIGFGMFQAGRLFSKI